jgi:hypothetical protein
VGENMIIRIGYVRGSQGLPGPPGPAWAGGQILLERVNILESDVNSAVLSLQSNVNQKVQAIENGMSELSGEVDEKLIGIDTEINKKVDEKIEIMESVYIRKDNRGANNGVAELDGNGLIPEYRLPNNVAWVGGDINVSFNNLIGKIIESGIFNESEGQLEC